jgi:hypothetical protein|tara:strand:+ start:326 stop:679 length:354 start_codon:yes stop_codon:yes gene_type:complete
MATVNQFKFFGVNLATTAETAMFGTNAAGTQLPTINQTYIIKSFRVTNNTGNTPTITIKNNTFNIVNTQTLAANSSTEILTLPLIVEGSTALKVTMSSTDSVTIGISYMNINKETID